MKQAIHTSFITPPTSIEDWTVLDLFQKQVVEHPSNVAVVFEDKILTYLELDVLSNQLAHYLTSMHGIAEGDCITILLERSEMSIVCMLGILKCGAAYVPIEPSYPLQRIEYIIKDSSSALTIDDNFLSLFISSTYLDKSYSTFNFKVNPNHLAYVIYTSGSTGNPKGVMVEHSNLYHYTSSCKYLINSSNTNSGCFAHLSFSFDASITDVFVPLSYGKKMIIGGSISEGVFSDANLYKYAPYDFIKLTPSHISLLIFNLNRKYDVQIASNFVVGGEALYQYHLNLFANDGIQATVINEYGPTETTVGCCIYKCATSKVHTSENIPIGKALPNTQLYIVNKEGQVVPDGEIGELCIAGKGVTKGYINRPELNAEKFCSNPFNLGTKMYRSGDLVKKDTDGNIIYLGRIDDQVKVNGYRIELGEIEAALVSLPEIKLAAVIVNKDFETSRIVAYLKAEENSTTYSNVAELLSTLLPTYMIPSIFMWVDQFPLNSNGKIDKKSLPKPEYIRPSNAPLFRKPKTELQKNIATVWQKLLHIPSIGIDDNFFEMGATSLLVQKAVAVLNNELDSPISVTNIYQYPTVGSLSSFLDSTIKEKAKFDFSKTKKNTRTDAVAIIGMAGRFPGANTIPELWEVLKNGKETISFFKREDLDAAVPDSLRNDPLYVAARGIIPSANLFDASFFGINPKLAEVMDPQFRLFLEIAWETLEQTGYLPAHYNGKTGVYAGVGTNTYYKKNILPNAAILDQIGYLQAETVNEKDYIASRTAYQLDLKGPAVSIQSACSTSLLAIAQAVEAIRNGHCNLALAGGSNVTAPINSGHLYQEGSMLSNDGHCRSFDADAKGTVFSDGAGVVLLKSLEDAQKDGDTIYGIIKGVGINNDGGNKGSFTAPSTEGQADAIAHAMQDANIAPETISYVETHGTATPLGDPIEIEGLKMAFGPVPEKESCAIGSVKSNMGHLTAAAGVAGLIKTVLAMYHQQLPPSLGFENPNPIIDFKNSPFFVTTQLRDWKSTTDLPLRAGVSSFGVGGTNVHLVVEEYPQEIKVSGPSRPEQLLLWSAKTAFSAQGFQKELGKFLNTESEISLADIAYSLQKTRQRFAHRSFLVGNTSVESANQLLSIQKNSLKLAVLKSVPSELVFLFPGQGSQYPQMGMALYQHEKVYQETIDLCAELLKKDLLIDIRTVLYPEQPSPEAEAQLKDTRFTQPALFVTEYALAQLWKSWGIQPTAICGHSIGEFVGGVLAGIFSLEDALHLIALRGQMVNELPTGNMLSVRMSEEELLAILPKTLSLAAVNSPVLCVVAGEASEILSFSKILQQAEIANKQLFTSHAFHSHMMDAAVEPFETAVRKIKLGTPSLPITSSVTGTWLTDEEATDPTYWSNHMREAVRYSPAAKTLLKLDDPTFLEVGPGQTLTALTKQHGAGNMIAAYTSLPLPKENGNDYQSILTTMGELWLRGFEPDWQAFYKDQQRQLIALPSYVFDRKPCWIDPPKSAPIAALATKNEQLSIEAPLVTEPTNDLLPMRKITILNQIAAAINQTSGVEYPEDATSYSFLELGLDSLTLTQLAIRLKKEFKLPITFRQLNEGLSSPDLLADFLDAQLPPEPVAIAPKVVPIPHPSPVAVTVASYTSPVSSEQNNTALGLIAQQIQLLGKQIELLQGAPIQLPTTNHQAAAQQIPQPILAQNTNADSRTANEIVEHSKPFGASPKIEKLATELAPSQAAFLAQLAASYTKKTAASKTYAQKNRGIMADPRVVTGFKPLTKEMVYPLVIKKSTGNQLWDIDGNQYLDALNGFGSCFFGHQPDFIKEALHQQIESGFEVGPQHPLAAEVCELLLSFTNQDRAALCNTGSEAVLGAMRIARTYTGRSLIVAFTGSYHGINDEALVRGSKKGTSFPAAAGIMPESVQNMLLLDYGTDESLRIITERADEIAAVLVEPVQSRRPEFQPIAFLKQLRAITEQNDIALVFDEVITGFRSNLGGAQALFGIEADIATYGKVIGGGISIGAILGKRKYLDTLDGGQWSFGDDSIPEIGVTYFAGTFVRHPLALASCKASLLHLKKQGPALHNRLNAMTDRLATELNAYFSANGLPMIINHFSSLWRMKFNDDVQYTDLLFTVLREKGIHIMDGFPCFLTEPYTDQDIDFIIATIQSSLVTLVQAGFYGGTTSPLAAIATNKNRTLNTPPVPNAKLGRDPEGNTAWFVEDKVIKGAYDKINL
ncbi:polyketide synthase [Flavobacterium algicola]|uniref:polyketide synthase n=1 Tax=Flavobacterium algicola TaxID=556529 RepID=UPI001EFDCC81|nr:polyketide synthase [Flavobacterium algicola]MCG9793503.1 amino acid adenylation domain-containing protein [Flavobacterium algicola]